MAKPNILAIVLTPTLLLGMLGIISIPNPATPTSAQVKWSAVNIPAEGDTGNWVLASGSNVQQLAMAIDGSLYCHANPSGTSYTLFKSTDNGSSWSYTGGVKDTIVDIATASDNASIVYYATSSNIYKSADAGRTFKPLPANPGGAGANNVEITSIDVARLDGKSTVAVGTRDIDSSQFGGVYLLNEDEPNPRWLDTKIGSYDIGAIAFSPDFAADRQLVAVVTDEKDTLVTTRFSDAGWGKIIGDATIKGVTTIRAAMAFPDDYDATQGDYTLFVAVDTGSDNGDVYRIRGRQAPDDSLATDLNIGSAYDVNNVDVTGLAVSGNATAATMMAGTAGSAQVYISSDSGKNWTRSTKGPTGQSGTCVLMSPDFTKDHRAYAATSGIESALSYTADGGISWNQIGLIDTRISDNSIIDLAVSPNYARDNTLFMLTWGDKHSLWRTQDGGTNWARVFNSIIADADSIKMVRLSPGYGNGSQVVFLAGVEGSNSVIWKSKDSGQTFTHRLTPFPIDTWVVVNDNTLFLGSYDGSHGLVYCTTDGGFSYSTGAATGSQPLKSLAVSPIYEQDGTILVGNTVGRVYLSTDNGSSFKLLGQQLPLSTTGVGEITVAFDPKFSSNKTVYAADNAKVTAQSKERIYRFIVGKSSAWEGIDSTLPIGSLLNQLLVSDNGTLYAANSQRADASKKEGGLERSLNPTYSLGPAFETVTRGLDDGATLTGLWLCGNQLWSIDTKNTRLMTYIDSLALPVTLVSPADKAPGIGVKNASLDWKALEGATKYQWQLDYDTNFPNLPAEFDGETEESSARLPALEAATTYYWRVRAIEPVSSPWSPKWSFTSTLGTLVVAPELYCPEAGDTKVPARPIFQWSAIAGADSYELLVSTDAAFTNPIIARTGDTALPATAWQSDLSLNDSATYYWKVRAIGSNSCSAWSAVGAFTTEKPSPPQSQTPAPTPSQLPPTAPSSAPAVIQASLPTWVTYLGIVLLLAILLLLVIILVIIAGRKRSLD